MTEKAFQSKFSFFNNKFSCYPSAKKIIDEKLVMNREKLVAFYTKHIFTSGHTRSQKSEWLNDFLKYFGSLKKEMMY